MPSFLKRSPCDSGRTTASMSSVICLSQLLREGRGGYGDGVWATHRTHHRAYPPMSPYSSVGFSSTSMAFTRASYLQGEAIRGNASWHSGKGTYFTSCKPRKTLKHSNYSPLAASLCGQFFKDKERVLIRAHEVPGLQLRDVNKARDGQKDRLTVGVGRGCTFSKLCTGI